jgi:hypothetical protein
MIRPPIVLILWALAVSLTGCSTMQNTPQQDYTYPLLKECVGRFPGASLKRVESDGRWWIMYTDPSALAGVKGCMQEETKARPYLDWLKARQASTPTGGNAIVAAEPAAISGPIAAPAWKVGDEWGYAYKSPSDSGTYVWAVDRLEMLEGTQHYVIKTGTRELFYRVSDLASSLERVDGVVVLREMPPRLTYAWPLAVGKSWEESHRQERPVDRTTTDRNSQWTVESEETVTVPAGTFRTLRITWRNKNTGAMLYEMWYAPAAKQWIKIREILSNGMRERELIAYKLN